mgnify:CR=1 FL=1
MIGVENGTFELGILVGEVWQQKVNGFQLKSYQGPTPPYHFRNAGKFEEANAGLLLATSISGVKPLPH